MEMDLEDILEKIPPIEKILGLIWILSWICAIWIYHIQFFLTGLFCLFLILIILGLFDKKEEEIQRPPFVFSMDENTRTLTVQKIYEDSIKWEDNEICSGDANLPTGEIKEGDVVTDCEGNVAFRHVPTNTLIGGYDFKKQNK
jgi:hypothetical protein